jgi:glycine betaine catabolism A
MPEFRKTTETFEAGSLTLPGSYYADEGVFAAEREAVFARHWTCVGREDDISNKSEFFLACIAGESVIVLRDDQGALRAFYNVCRHRGTAICASPSGTLPAGLQCPYHGWTYDLTGRLRVAPHMDEVADFDREMNHLHAVHLASASGLIFLSLAAHPEPFERTVEPLFARFERWALGDLKTARRIDYDVAANWKIIVENYSECYHCPLVHPDFSQKVRYRSGCNDAFEGPLLGGFMDLKEGVGSLTRTGARCGPTLGKVGGEDLARIYFYAVFPNVTISLHPDYAMVFVLQPINSGRTLVRCEWLFPPAALADGACSPDEAVAFWDHTNREDWKVCALVQQGVQSRCYRPSPMSNTESLPAAFNRHVVKALEAVLSNSSDESRHIGRSCRH